METKHVIVFGLSLCVVGIFAGFYFATFFHSQSQTIIGLVTVGSIFTVLSWLGRPFEVLGVLTGLYKEYHDKPDLKIYHEEDNPDQCSFIGNDNDKKYLTVCVENKGKGIARKCKARLVMINKFGSDLPKTERKFLRWAQKDTTKMTIYPGDREYLNVAFSVEKPFHNMIAFVAEKDSINNPESPRDKDGFRVGRYDFEIIVNTAKGEFKGKFRINVADDWKELSMKNFE